MILPVRAARVEGIGRVPHVRPSVHGPKTDSSNAFTSRARTLPVGRSLTHVTVGLEGPPDCFPKKTQSETRRNENSSFPSRPPASSGLLGSNAHTRFPIAHAWPPSQRTSTVNKVSK